MCSHTALTMKTHTLKKEAVKTPTARETENHLFILYSDYQLQLLLLFLIVAKSVCIFQLPFMLSAATLFWEII